MNLTKRDKKTVIFVTHDMNSVRRFCDRVLLIADGDVVELGAPAKVAATYTKLNQSQYDKEIDKQNKEKVEPKLKLELQHLDSTTTVGYKTGEKIRFHFKWQEDLKFKNLGVAIIRENGEFLFGCNTLNDKFDIERRQSFNCDIKLMLGSGKYHVMYGAFGDTEFDVVEFIDEGPAFTIQDMKQDWEGLLYMESNWYK